jgi:hypothetical protein
LRLRIRTKISSSLSPRSLQSDTLVNLLPLIRPWHQLVCQSGGADLLSAASNFFGERSSEPRELPDRVRRMIEPRDRAADCTHLDEDYSGLEKEIPDDLFGLMIICDTRD